MADAVHDGLCRRVSPPPRRNATSRGGKARPHERRVSPVTVYELWLQPLTRHEEVFHIATMSVLDEVAFASDAARLVADWLRGLSQAARLRLTSDAMIAASAATVGATVYTRNVRDLSRFYPNVQSY